MKRIQTFKDYINEQEKSTEKDILGGLNAGEMAKGMLAMGLDSLGIKSIDYGNIAETPETKGGKPYTGCGNSPYVFKPSESTNQDVINLFKDPNGAFNRDVKYAEIHRLLDDPNNKKIFLVGVREVLETKIKEGDKFVDKILVVDPTAPTAKIISYQITTCPSVVYYGDVKRTINKDGVAIMQPGVTKYAVGIHRKGKSGEHEALVQAGEMNIDRFKVGTTQIDTYAPGNPDKGAEYGINIHRSSQERGVCVGPWSAGCQVFADGTDFANFMAKMKSSTANGNTFLYALIENDVLAKKSETESAASDKSGDTDTAGKASEFEAAADAIRNELGGEKSWKNWKNSDEGKIISTYNGVVNSKEDADAIAAVYRKKFNTDIMQDMDRALSKKEHGQLNTF
jgi:hypothetical protein